MLGAPEKRRLRAPFSVEVAHAGATHKGGEPGKHHRLRRTC
jgi:hypothetical protein